MTLPRLAAITEYQRDNPPLQWMVSAYLGVEPKKDSQNSGNSRHSKGRDENGQSLFDLFPTTRG